MIRTLLTAAFVLLLSTSTVTAGNTRKGVGCWRTVTAHHKAAARMMSRHKMDNGTPTNYRGEKRGLVILAEFTDTKFANGHDRDKYDNILNTPGYTTNEGFVGSVNDYFRDQSAGLFDLHFDVVGPYTTKHNYKYYGENDVQGLDLRPQDMITEMCHAADDDVNFADYDWDGDGEVDEVFVLYAGKGESDNTPGKPNLIWPHMWTLVEANGQPLQLDGVDINIYACSNELSASGRINGIGTFCHEFSHCLGLPDFYDITYSGAFGMHNFDLMSRGNYAGNGFRPVGYTAYEKMACGWQEPIVLSDQDVTIDSIKPISEDGNTYIIYNDTYPDEFYMIENRQNIGWDTNYPAKGLMITHVDYDAEVWENNIPNSILTLEEALKLELTCGNDHQRMAFFHADDNDDSKYWSSIGRYYTKSTLTTDLYPYLTHDSLTATSKPAATLFHENSQGTKLMQGAILDITQNDDGTMSFRYRVPNSIPDGIKTIEDTGRCPDTIYDLKGRKIVHGTSSNGTLPPGIYIVQGKKYIQKR